MNMNKRSKFAAFISSRGFYVAIAVCLVGAGAATWLAVDRTISGIEDQNNRIVQNENRFTSIPPLEEAARNQPDIPVQPSFPAAPSPAPSPASSPAAVSDPPAQSTPPPSQPAAQSSPAPSSAPAAASASPTQSQAPVRLSYSLPVKGDITKPFSNGELVRDRTLGEWRTHNGVDIAAERGTEVIAAAEGTIADARRDERWGGVVVIGHPDGNQTTYSGLSWPLPVKAGDIVNARQVIGTIDGVPTESADGIHLHFELSTNGTRADPLSLIATRD